MRPEAERLRAFMALEDAVTDDRNMAWIAALLEHEFRNDVSRERPGKYVIEIDEVASEVLTWSIFEANRLMRDLFNAFHKVARNDGT